MLGFLTSSYKPKFLISEVTGETWSLYPDNYMVIIHKTSPEPILPGTYKDLETGELGVKKPTLGNKIAPNITYFKNMVAVCKNPVSGKAPLMPPHVMYEFMKRFKVKSLYELKTFIRWGYFEKRDNNFWVLDTPKETLIGVST